MVDSATSVPMAGVQFVATWPARSRIPDPNYQRSFRQALTDSRGAATFCDVPSNMPLDVSLVSPGGDRIFVTEVRLDRNGLVGKVVTGKKIR
jgi:hypothetical protein